MNSIARFMSLLSMVLFIFLGQNVVAYYNFEYNTFHAMLFMLCIIAGLSFSSYWRKDRRFMILLMCVIIISVLKMYTDRGEGSRAIAISIMGPAVMMMAYPLLSYNKSYENYSFWKKINWLFYVGFLVEVLLALFERFSGANVFGWKSDIVFSIDDYGVTDYRSTALYGHPLGNAYMVSIAMIFLLTSKLKNKYKFTLWGLGFLALLCFNCRSYIVGNAALLAVYGGYMIFFDKQASHSTKRGMVLAVGACAAIGYYALFYGGMGGRLLDMGLFDDSSAQARINLWDIFRVYDVTDFLMGMSLDSMMMLMSAFGIHIMENWLLVFLFRIGLLMLIPLLWFNIVYAKRRLVGYGKFEKLFISISFILFSFTCNSFSSDYNTLFYFYILLELFNPNIFPELTSQKYIDKNYLYDRNFI